MRHERDTLKVELHLENRVTITLICDDYAVPSLISQLRASRVLRAEVTAIAPPPRPEPVVEKFQVGDRRTRVFLRRQIQRTSGFVARRFGLVDRRRG